MLEMRPNCESCDSDLPATTLDAYICSFECTYCLECSDKIHAFVCPNCRGALTKRPSRVGEALAKHPANTKRVLKAS